MKKRILNSLAVILFLLVIFKLADSNDNTTEYKTDSPFAGVSNVVPDISSLPQVDENEVVAVAEPEPTIEDSELYLSYIGMGYTSDDFYRDLDLLAAITIAEAGNQPEIGKRWVIDTVLNRIDSDLWRDDLRIVEAITHPGQYETYSNGAYTRVTIDEDTRRLVEEEILNRTNYDVIYFKTDGYFTGAPEIDHIGDHWFSGDYKW